MCCFKSDPTMQLPSTSWFCCISQSMLWNIYNYYRQNRLSLTPYSAYAFHYHHRPCIPAGRGSTMSLRDPPVSGKFLAHLARFVLEAFVCLSHLLCVPQQFLFSKQIVFLMTYFLHIFTRKAFSLNFYHAWWMNTPRHVHSTHKHSSCISNDCYIIHQLM